MKQVKLFLQVISRAAMISVFLKGKFNFKKFLESYTES